MNMSDAIYFAKTNFAKSYRQATDAKHNPLGLLRQASQSLATKVQNDDPTAGIFRQDIPAHLRQHATLGLRQGAKAGSYVGGFLHALTSPKLSQNSAQQPCGAQNEHKLKSSTTLTENMMGIAGTLSGGLIGLMSNIMVAGGLLGGILMGAAAGAIVRAPYEIAYTTYVLTSSKKRQELRHLRDQEKLAGLAALRAEISNLAEPAESASTTKAARTTRRADGAKRTNTTTRADRANGANTSKHADVANGASATKRADGAKRASTTKRAGTADEARKKPTSKRRAPTSDRATDDKVRSWSAAPAL